MSPLGMAKAVGTGPEGLVDPRGLWCGLKGEIALFHRRLSRGVCWATQIYPSNPSNDLPARRILSADVH